MNYDIEYCCISHTGHVRQNNQDNLLCQGRYLEAVNGGTPEPLSGTASAAASPLFGVFDGMGGEAEGETAAWLAARSAAGHRPGKNAVEDLRRLCRDANREVCRYADDHGITTMGTTAAILRFEAGGVYACNLGDSRIFLLRDGALEQISQDQVMPAPGARKPPLLQFLGIPETEMELSPYITVQQPRLGDRYLACSDGLTDMLGEPGIRGILAGAPVAQAADRLVREALAAGGRDNVTVLLCEIQAPAAGAAAPSPGKPGWLERLRRRVFKS